MFDRVEGFFQLPELPPFITLAAFGFHGKLVETVVDCEGSRSGQGSKGYFLPIFVFDEEVVDFKL